MFSIDLKEEEGIQFPSQTETDPADVMCGAPAAAVGLESTSLIRQRLWSRLKSNRFTQRIYATEGTALL